MRLRKWWQRAAALKPGAKKHCKPWSCCSKADQELQQLLLSELPELRPVLGPDFLQAAWKDLEELVERNSLPCHCCTSAEIQSCTGKGNIDSLKVASRAQAKLLPVCPTGCLWCADTYRALTVHIARKSLEVHMAALPKLLLISHQLARERQCSHVLPKPIKPGQTQAKGKCIAGSVLKKKQKSDRGVPSPGDFPILMPCAPYILLPWDVGQARKTIQQKAQTHSQGQAQAQQHPQKQCCPQESAEIALPPSHAADKEQEHPTATVALPGSDNTSKIKDASCQTDCAGFCVTDIKSRSQCVSKAHAVVSKLQLGPKTFGKLSMHVARKCLEIKLRCLPELVRKSMWRQRWMSRTRPAGTMASKSQLVNGYFPIRRSRFLNEKRETLELHIRSLKLKRCENLLISGSPSKPAVSQEEESTSSYVSATSVASWAEVGPKGQKQRAQSKKSPSRGKSKQNAEGPGFPTARLVFRYCPALWPEQIVPWF